jgi:hypothetical protein
MASAGWLFDPVCGCASNHEASAVAASRHCGHDSTDPIWSPEQSARRWNRRLNALSGTDDFPTPAAICQFQPPQAWVDAAFSSTSRTPFELAQCWQFRWRTALEPRAPSTIS